MLNVERAILLARGFLIKAKMNKSALSMDKEWRGFFVPRRKG
jgi:hypothetical protein